MTYRGERAKTRPGQGCRGKIIKLSLNYALGLLEDDARCIVDLAGLAASAFSQTRGRNGRHELHAAVRVTIGRGEGRVHGCFEVVRQLLGYDGLVGDDEAHGAGIEADGVVCFVPELARESRLRVRPR